MYAFLTIKFMIHALYYAHDKSITVKGNNLNEVGDLMLGFSRVKRTWRSVLGKSGT